ncbi:MAG: S8 family serine peptidase [Actinomycetota bacterium]
MTLRTLGVAIAMALLSTSSAAGGDACHNPADPAYDGYGCKVERLRDRSFVVVAVPDTGINPYHEDFRLPANDDLQGVPPWEFIEGYPDTALPVPLSLNATDYHTAVAKDEEIWDTVEEDTLHYFPGTKIIGGYSVSGDQDGVTTDPPILDANGHGTATASLVGGLNHGFSRDVDTLIVVVQGWTLEWAFEQPWIDVISNSWGYLANVSGSNSVEKSRSKEATGAGKVVAFAAGNGVSGTGLSCDRALTTTSYTSAPWNLVVGAVSPKNQQDHCWQSIPPDVSSYGSAWPAAARDSTFGERNFSGTSCSTPLVAGVVADQILEARRAFGDTTEGPHGQVALAVASEGAALPSSGPLADGILVRTEVEETTMKTADPASFDPTYCVGDPLTCGNTTPTTPAYFAYQGYGIVNQASAGEAMDVLLGRAPMPNRAEVDTWMAVKDTVNGTVWNTVP